MITRCSTCVYTRNGTECKSGRIKKNNAGDCNLYTIANKPIFKGVSFEPPFLQQILAELQKDENDSQCICRVLKQGLTPTPTVDPVLQILLSKLVKLFYANAEKIDFQGVTFDIHETAIIESYQEPKP